MYTEADREKASARARREGIIAAALLAAGLAAAIVALTARERLPGALALGLFSMLAYAQYALRCAPWRRYARFLSELLSGRSRENEGFFDGIEPDARLSEEGVLVRGVSVRETSNGGALMYYWDAGRPFPPLAPGGRVSLTTYGRYIRALCPAEKSH
ncbi:hypothetical protein ACH6CV_01255 [Bacillota bacterium Meth-B3]|nr:hypothetical protein [Christensenellaceae bacterium]MEA5065063.1 hypothetical protein [Eubacteriales bacterium]MEA5067589.1 hypothetical protein [Christensenellaceae bacterium]